uniref:Uncharacterized protein n=1 Tax=Cacopsylla melanoneura TaxID=428564 RepID=A0A8D8YTQ2_9HEMI
MKPHSKMSPNMSTLFDKLFKTTQRDKQRFGMLYESFLKSKRRSKYQREENARIKSKSSLLDKSKFLYDIPDSMIFPNTADKDETEQNADVFLKEFGELLDNDYYLPESVLVQLGLSHLIEKNDNNTQQNKSTVDTQKSSYTKTVSNNAFQDKFRSMNFPCPSSSNTSTRESITKNTNQEILEKINSLKRKFNAQSGQPLQTGILSPKQKIVSQNHSTSGNENNSTNNKAVVTEQTRIAPNLKNNLPSQKLVNNSDDLEVVFCETKTNLNPSLKIKSSKRNINLSKKTVSRTDNNKLGKSLNKLPSVTLRKPGNTLTTTKSTKIPNTKISAKSTVVPALTGSTQLHDIHPSNDKTNTNSQSSSSQIPGSTSQKHNKQGISRSKVRKSRTTRKQSKKQNRMSMFESLLSKHLPSILNSISQMPIQVIPQTPWPENHFPPILNNSEGQNGSLNPNNPENLNHSNLTISQFRSLNYNGPIQVPIILPRNKNLETSNTDQVNINKTEGPLHTAIKSEVDHTNLGDDLVNNENGCTNANQNDDVPNPTQDDKLTKAPFYSTTDATRTPLNASNDHLPRSEVVASIMDSILSLTSERQTQLDTILKTEIENTQHDHLSTNQEEIDCPSQSEQVTNEDTNSNQENALLPMCTNEEDISANETRRPLIFLKSPSQLLKAPSTTSSEEVSNQAKNGNPTTEKSLIEPNSSEDLETLESTPATSSPPNPDLRPSTGNLIALSSRTGLPETEHSGRSQHPETHQNPTKGPEKSQHLETRTTSQETQNSSQLGRNTSEPTPNESDHQSVLNKMLDFNAEMMKLLTEQKNQLEELMKENTSFTKTACYACSRVNEVLDDMELTDDRKLVRLKIIQRNQRISQNSYQR